jgi:hypothetical protein
LLGTTRDVAVEQLLNGIMLMDTGSGDLGRGGQFRDKGWEYDIFIVDA